MSKHWGYVCQSHDPELASEPWFNRGDQLLRDVQAAECAGQFPQGDAFWDADVEIDGVDVRHAVSWLREHPRCKVALRNEYGDTQS